jgi:hypothetical protein
MKELLDQIGTIEFVIGPNLNYDLGREFQLISSYLDPEEQEFLKMDFECFFEKGRFLVLNTFCGGILFLKVSEPIEKIKIESRSNSKCFEASVIFKSESRRTENTKYKPKAGRTESVKWNVDSIFPNYYKYQKTIQNALLIVIGKIVKSICEYGRANFVYMRIENEFKIELLMDGRIESQLKVELH